MTNTYNKANYLQLDAVQGRREARTELYFTVQRRSTAVSDEVMRQELWQSFVLCTKAGQSGGGV